MLGTTISHYKVLEKIGQGCIHEDGHPDLYTGSFDVASGVFELTCGPFNSNRQRTIAILREVMP